MQRSPAGALSARFGPDRDNRVDCHDAAPSTGWAPCEEQRSPVSRSDYRIADGSGVHAWPFIRGAVEAERDSRS